MDKRSLAALAAAGSEPMDTFAQDFQSGMQSGASLAGAVRDSMISERMAKMAEAVKDGGDLMNIDESLYADPLGMEALGKFQRHYISTREGMQKSAKLNRELATQAAEDFYSGLQALEQNKNTPEAAAAIAQRLSKKLPLPYQLGPGQEPGRLNIYYQDRGGNRQMGQTISVDDVIGMLKEAGKNSKQLTSQIGMYLLSNISRNMEYKQDPKTWLYSESGQQLVPQKQMHNGIFEVGYIPIGSNEFITQEEAQRRYGKMLTFDQYESVRKMGQGDRQLDISQQNANTSAAGLGLSRERFAHEQKMDIDRFAYQKDKDANQETFEKRRLDISQEGMDTSRKRLEWEMGGGKQKSMTPGQLRQVEKEYTHDLMSDRGFVYKNGAYVREERDKYGYVTKQTTAPASLVNAARAEARKQVEQDYGRTASGKSAANESPAPRVTGSGNRPSIHSFLMEK